MVCGVVDCHYSLSLRNGLDSSVLAVGANFFIHFFVKKFADKEKVATFASANLKAQVVKLVDTLL